MLSHKSVVLGFLPQLLLHLLLQLLGITNHVVILVESFSFSSSSSSPSSNTWGGGGGGGGGGTTRNVATQVLQGAGTPKVDLNRYNLKDLSQIEQEWTVNLVVQSPNEQQAKVKAGVKSSDLFFVDTVLVSFSRTKDKDNSNNNGSRSVGLGIELTELLGGRPDGIGLTLVSGIVPGGPLEGTDICVGDLIAKVSILRQQQQQQQQQKLAIPEPDSSWEQTAATTEKQQEVSVVTECLDYDATVSAIRSVLLAPATSTSSPDLDWDQETFVLTLKRIRRKPKVQVKLQYPPSQGEPDATIELFAGENLRYGMLIRGVKLNDPLAQRFDTKSGGNCGAGGLCRTCAISIVQGKELLNEARVAEQQMLQDTPRWRLACKAIVGFGMQEGSMTIRVNPRQWN